jgi:hypothetical protein
MDNKKSKTTLDLRVNGGLDSSYCQEIEQIAQLIRSNFNEFVTKISKPNKDNLDWWVETPGSRNTYVSDLFHYCCLLELLARIIGRNESISCILVDSKAYRNVTLSYLERLKITSISVNVVPKPFKERFEAALKPYFFVFATIMKHLISYIMALVSGLGLKTQKAVVPLTLIDTFVFPGFIEEDRTYPGLWNTIDKKKRASIFFVPNLYGFSTSRMYQTYRKLRKAKRNFLLKEDYLRLSDYIYAFNHFWRRRKIKIVNAHFNGFNLAILIKNELFNNKGFNSAVMAILNYRFASRLKDNNISLRGIINRFENQTIDKGWNAGFLKFYPNSEIIGYQSFVASPYYLCSYPTEFENKCGVLPKKIALMGQGHVIDRREFFPQLSSIIAPALRYKWLWKSRNIFPSSDKFIVLVALPIITPDFINILNILNSISDDEMKKIEFVIKLHPALSLELIQKKISFNITEKFRFLTGSFNCAIENAHLLMGNSSSTSLETLARGIPVIVIGNSHGLTYNPIPKGITKKIWRICYTQKEIIYSIHYFQNNASNFVELYKKTGEQIRKDYFAPTTATSINKLMGFV